MRNIVVFHEAVAMVIDNTFRLPKTDAKIFPSPGLFRTAEKGHQRLWNTYCPFIFFRELWLDLGLLTG